MGRRAAGGDWLAAGLGSYYCLLGLDRARRRSNNKKEEEEDDGDGDGDGDEGRRDEISEVKRRDGQGSWGGFSWLR